MKPRNKALLLVLIAILVGYQAVVSWTSYILPTASRAWDPEK